ncbi:S-layer homology domain-containing protein [Paenibacillus sp. 2TAB23]|uniref:S-layer homology domain-containing protein n=1 Tax=Paenibacillus sp. 2TAB23 TaxID=3233004 RepID=UPI003F99EDAF
MNTNRFIAWLLLVSVFMTMLSANSQVSYAAEDAHEHAYDVLEHTENSQEDEDAALSSLNIAADIEKPIISSTGLVDQQQAIYRKLSFMASAVDTADPAVQLAVNLNGDLITAKDETYTVSLQPGDNVITLTAIDTAGNRAEESYTVHYAFAQSTAAAEQLEKSLAYLVKTVKSPKFGTGAGEWSVISLARANYPVPDKYYDSYYYNVTEQVRALLLKYGGKLDNSKSTEHSRLIMGLASIGRDIHSVAGYDISQALADFDYVIKQGINGPVFALIALDTHQYEVPLAEGAAVQTTREKLVQYILNQEVKKDAMDAGGWGFGTTRADVDLTAMTLQSLAPYYETDSLVKAAADRAVQWLSATQNAQGSYTNFGSTSSESIAQVIVALTGLGIDPHADPRFIKNNKSLIDALLAFSVEGGGFKHVATGKLDGMATDQGTYALVSYDRYLKGENRLYDMTDVQLQDSQEMEFPLPAGEKPSIAVPDGGVHYVVPVPTGNESKEITIEIPEQKNGSVSVHLPLNSSLPQIEAKKGSVTAVIPKGAKIIGSDSNILELITTLDPANSTLKNKLAELIAEGRKLSEIAEAFTMGGRSMVEFNEYVTLVFAGHSGKDAAYIQGGAVHAIQKYESDALGAEAGEREYAYDSGNDLIVKTKHFTDFVSYATSVLEAPGGGNGAPSQPTQYVTQSVDKLAINKGYVLPSASVELKAGDTVWTVLKRTLDAAQISFDFDWNETYGSVYVKTIAGDGEFDHGQDSGWMYNVNGIYPDYGASKYTLKPGDRIQWRYTTNLGIDLDAGGYDRSPIINVPKGLTENYVVSLTKSQLDTDNITINIGDVQKKVILNVSDVKESIPMVTVVKGAASFIIDKGTKLNSGETNVELFTALDAKQATVEELINRAVGSKDKFGSGNQSFTIGSEASAVRFDKPFTIIVKDGKNQLAGVVENNKYVAISIYATEEKGVQATIGSDKKAYAFVKGNDLYIKTNQTASFVTYTASSSLALDALYKDADTISKWALDAIGQATQNGFVQGSNGKFNPKAAVTRAEFAKMLAAVMNLDTASGKASAFTDVAKTDWFYPYVTAASHAGYMTGFNQKFSPNDSITREQMATTLVRALGIASAKPADAVKDLDKASAWAKADIEAAIASELMVGDRSGFLPKATVTREMAAVAAMRAYDFDIINKPEDTNADQSAQEAVRKQIAQTAAFMQNAVSNPTIASVGGDWTVLGLARSEISVPDSYYAKYYANVEQTLKEQSGKLHNVKYTEYDRVILALTAIGKSVDQVAGYNLLEPLADYDTVIKQGINGPIFALVALDSKAYDIPVVAGAKKQTTRELLIDFILGREITDGGWALGANSTAADPDITSMAIQGLTPYYATNDKVKAAVDRGVAWLSKAQMADGSFASGGSANSESIAQVIVALAGLGIDPHQDARFVKNGHSAVEALLGYGAASGGFYHVKQGGTDNGGAKPGEVDLMASDQALYAFVAYNRFVAKQTRLYDMRDVA